MLSFISKPRARVFPPLLSYHLVLSVSPPFALGAFMYDVRKEGGGEGGKKYPKGGQTILRWRYLWVRKCVKRVQTAGVNTRSGVT